jgi:hypothetical protein
MVDNVFKLEPIPETEEDQQQPRNDAGMAMLMMGLSALSKRALAAMPALFAIPAVGSAFWLWYLTPKPDTYQIVSLSIYAGFVFAICWLVRQR